jgi:uncharacterized flavoprotein (TIGR03862 family)
MNKPKQVAIIGGGPAGLMAAEQLSFHTDIQVQVYDAMPSVGRKFLLAGIGGLNLTHAQAPSAFTARYAARAPEVSAWLAQLSPQALRDWAQELGIETFVGSSQRVFPKDMKAAPLLRAWLHRLREREVRFHSRHVWRGWAADESLLFDAPDGTVSVKAHAVVLALGGASWPRLGSNGAWLPLLLARGVNVAPLAPANCGFDVQGGWSEYLRTRFAGEPLKSIALSISAASGLAFHQLGEAVLTQTGLEGSLVYAASALIRDTIAAQGSATIRLDLLPARSVQWLTQELAHARGARSFATHLNTRLNLKGVKLALLHEAQAAPQLLPPEQLAGLLKALPITISNARPIAEAISSAGGVRLEALTPQLMCQELPGVFCAGEMLDWEAPTGGYLLTAVMASGRVAGQGVVDYLR